MDCSTIKVYTVRGTQYSIGTSHGFPMKGLETIMYGVDSRIESNSHKTNKSGDRNVNHDIHIKSKIL